MFLLQKSLLRIWPFWEQSFIYARRWLQNENSKMTFSNRVYNSIYSCKGAWVSSAIPGRKHPAINLCPCCTSRILGYPCRRQLWVPTAHSTPARVGFPGFRCIPLHFSKNQLPHCSEVSVCPTTSRVHSSGSSEWYSPPCPASLHFLTVRHINKHMKKFRIWNSMWFHFFFSFFFFFWSVLPLRKKGISGHFQMCVLSGWMKQSQVLWFIYFFFTAEKLIAESSYF